MSAAPAITVLMPVHNAGAFLHEAIASTLSQTFSDFELLIINDGSTDDSAAIIGAFNDPRIRVIQHPGNLGLVAALNTGIKSANGRYIARMDADDVMLPERLKKQFDLLESRPEIAIVAAFVDFINAAGEVTGYWDTDRATPDEASINAMMPRTTCIAHPTVMIRRSSLGAMRYDPRMREGEDWELWLRILSRGLRITKIPEVLLHYRQHPDSFTSAAKTRRRHELRLMTMRWRFLLGEWASFRFTGIHPAVLKAQARSLARHLKLNVFPRLARNVHRILSYSPIELLAEKRALRKTLSGWNGRHVFIFPYLSMGGAEQVHADIVASVADQDPLVIFSGFSKDREFAERFLKSAQVLEIPRLLNHPWTRRGAVAAIARKINAIDGAVLMSSMTHTFFDLLPLLKHEVRTYYMQHAFLYQQGANLQNKAWMPHHDRIDAYLFPSPMALREFDTFLFHQNVPASRSAKLLLMPAAVPVFGEVRAHDRTGILFVGRDSPEKRIGLFLDIVDELERRRPARFRCTVAGAGEREGHPQVRFTGIISDPSAMRAAYGEHDLLVLCSTREGFSLVVTEAMANGLVVLSTPVGDVPARVDASSAFITSSVEAPVVHREMVDAIIALDEDRDRMQRMKTAALMRVRSELDPAAFRERYRALLIGNVST